MDMSNSTPSQSLSRVDAKQTKMVKINGKNMYKNPAIDVVFDKDGNFYSNKRQKGFTLLVGRKVHYILNLNGSIVKGNTTKKSLIKILLGDIDIKKIKADPIEVVTPVVQEPKKSVKAVKPIKKTKQLTQNEKIMCQIKLIESQLDELKQLVA